MAESVRLYEYAGNGGRRGRSCLDGRGDCRAVGTTLMNTLLCRISRAVKEGCVGLLIGGGVTLIASFGFGIVMSSIFPYEFDGGPGILMSALIGIGSVLGGLLFFCLRAYRAWTRPPVN